MVTVAIREPEDVRHAIYDGRVFCLPATETTRKLVAEVRAKLERLFGESLDLVHRRFTFDEMKEPMALVRAGLAAQADVLPRIAADAGLATDRLAIDALRLRCVMHNGHLNRGSALAYSAHRDTWYGNPQAQVNFWIPLQDVTPATSFMFYPGYFRRALANTSAAFKYGEWMDKRGWQGAKAHADVAYPRALEQPSGGRAFSARTGDIVLFSAAQLHQTVPNVSGRSRFSLDFRAVDLNDHIAGLGAPNVDNGSAPDALRDYRRVS